MCLIFLQNLLSREDFSNLLHNLILIVSIEGIVHSLEFIVNNQKFSFVFSRTSTFINYRNVAFDEIEFLQAQQGHVQPEIRALLVYLICVTGGHATEHWKPIRVASQTQIDFEIRYSLQHLKYGTFVLLKELLFDFLI